MTIIAELAAWGVLLICGCTQNFAQVCLEFRNNPAHSKLVLVLLTRRSPRYSRGWHDEARTTSQCFCTLALVDVFGVPGSLQHIPSGFSLVWALVPARRSYSYIFALFCDMLDVKLHFIKIDLKPNSLTVPFTFLWAATTKRTVLVPRR